MRENLIDWLRFYKREIVFVLIIFFVSFVSFGLGYLADRQWNRAPIVIQKAPPEAR